jgi:hypothetical protein
MGLRTGGIYEAVVFQAERHTSESSYRLTLRNFGGPRSECSWIGRRPFDSDHSTTTTAAMARIAAARLRPKPRRATRPTRASKERRIEGKKQRTQLKRLRGKPAVD